MPKVLLVPDDKTISDNPLPLASGETLTLGRGLEHLKITDKRCSRQQATLAVDGAGTVRLTRNGLNPMYVWKAGSAGNKIILDKATPIELRAGDRFSLIGDEVLFTIQIEPSSHELDRRMDMDTRYPKKRLLLHDSDGEDQPLASLPVNSHVQSKKPKVESASSSKDSEGAFEIHEVDGDLFDSADSLVHYISADLDMSKGLAARFNERLHVVRNLRGKQLDVGDVATVPDGNRRVYLLVLKERSSSKASLEQVQATLLKLSELCLKHKTKALSMSKIGGGAYDKLEWVQVKNVIKEIFKPLNIPITVYSYRATLVVDSPRSPVKAPPVLSGVSPAGSQSPRSESPLRAGLNFSTDPAKLSWREVKDGASAVLVLDSPVLGGSTKIVAFDMDDTLIRTKSGVKFPKTRDDWQWWSSVVPSKLKQLLRDGFKLAIFSNQAGIAKGHQKAEHIQGKIQDICKQLGVAVQAFVAHREDAFRKPSTRMWDYMVAQCNGGVKPDLAQCMYVGDAAGRLGDHSDSDRAFAVNCGIAFKTPEELFLGEAPKKMVWRGFDPTTYKEKKSDGKSHAVKHQEMVICVGMPACGKSSFTKRHFVSSNVGREYVRVNNDTLKSKDRCLSLAKQALTQGKSVVIDNTNPSKEVRAEYLRLANAAGVPARCFYFKTDLKFAQHLNLLRQKLTDGETKKIPDVAYHTFRGKFVEPTVSEGFTEVINVEFEPHFESEEHKKLFYQHH